jgi:hypothetical protein
MRTLPELEVDLNGNIKMVGNRPVTIHINSRPSPLRGEALTEFVRNLPADRIDRIEVIPNPSVRFEGGTGPSSTSCCAREWSWGWAEACR